MEKCKELVYVVASFVMLNIKREIFGVMTLIRLIITFNVPLFLKMWDIIFFVRAKFIMDPFQGAQDFLDP